MAFIPDKPTHPRFALRDVTPTQYKIYAKGYSRAKGGGLHCIYAYLTGIELVGVITDFSKGIVINYGKRKLAAVCLAGCGYVFATAMVMVTNASKIVKISKNIHSTAAFLFECIEDSSNLTFLPLDLAIFGQPIPIGAPNRFNLFSNHTDFLDV